MYYQLFIELISQNYEMSLFVELEAILLEVNDISIKFIKTNLSSKFHLLSKNKLY